MGPRPFEPSPVEPSGPVRLPRAAKTADDREPREECLAGPSNLCLNQSRFRVEVAWENQGGERGAGEVVPFGSDDSGLFWFFEDTNWEMLIKVLDGCPANGHFWVFAAATTDVAYTLTVTDTVTGLSKAYLNPLGTAAPAITDTGFFACGG